MTHKEQIKKAIKANFALRKDLNCNMVGEDYPNAALAFYEHLTGGKDKSLLSDFEKIIQNKRYKVKMQLIENYLKLNY